MVQQLIVKEIKLNILFCCLSSLTCLQISLVFELKYGDSTNVFTKQSESDYDGLLNFDVKVAQRIYFRLVGNTEEKLYRPSNCLNKNYKI